jgi:hypothetical protein
VCTIIGSKIFFAGGLEGKNISRTVWYYDYITKEVVKLPDFINAAIRPTIVEDDGGVCIIDQNNTLYKLEFNEWKKITTVDLSGDYHVYKKKKKKQYLISSGIINELRSGEIHKVYENTHIQPTSYIPSSDKDIIYFENGFYDIKNDIFNLSDIPNHKYIIYGEGYSDHNVIIDKERKLLFHYDHNRHAILSKTFSGKTWSEDILNRNLLSLPKIDHMIYNNNLYLLSVNGVSHRVLKLDLFSNEINELYHIERKNESYSKNIKFNHALSNIVPYGNDIAVVGFMGYYKDNSKYDNSLYLKDEIVPLQLNIKSPLYYVDEVIYIADQENDTIYQYSKRGNYLNKFIVPIENTIDSFMYSKDTIVFNGKDKSYVYDTYKREVTGVVTNNSLASCVDKFFRYDISLSEQGLPTLNKTSFMSSCNESYELELDINENDRIIMTTSQGKLIIYKERNNDWEIYRILFDE